MVMLVDIYEKMGIYDWKELYRTIFFVKCFSIPFIWKGRMQKIIEECYLERQLVNF